MPFIKSVIKKNDIIEAEKNCRKEGWLSFDRFLKKLFLCAAVLFISFKSLLSKRQI